MSDRMPDRAVVLGGSMAGLLAAGVLAVAYADVTVIDRDDLTDDPTDDPTAGTARRRGVPQGRHAHALLARGQQALEELFPGLTADLVARGAPTGDMLGEPLDTPVAFRFPASVRRHYERLARVPDGFLVVGDSMCSFNPVYGQGMTVAALEALTLRRHLRRPRGPRPRAFFRDIARVIDPPWDMDAGADLAFPGVEGHRTRRQRMAGAYISRLHAAAAHDARVASAFVHVFGLVNRPDTLLHPRVAVRVLRHHLRPHTHTAPPPAPATDP